MRRNHLFSMPSSALWAYNTCERTLRESFLVLSLSYESQSAAGYGSTTPQLQLEVARASEPASMPTTSRRNRRSKGPGRSRFHRSTPRPRPLRRNRNPEGHPLAAKLRVMDLLNDIYIPDTGRHICSLLLRIVFQWPTASLAPLRTATAH